MKRKAPQKEFYIFENSAHSLVFEEPEVAIEILREIVEYIEMRIIEKRRMM